MILPTTTYVCHGSVYVWNIKMGTKVLWVFTGFRCWHTVIKILEHGPQSQVGHIHAVSDYKKRWSEMTSGVS